MTYERSNIRLMQGYSAGEQSDHIQTIKLNSNENPYPPSKVVDKIIQNFSGAWLRQYPPPTAMAFREIAAAIHDVAPENIIATRGGDELLRLLITTFVNPGETIAMTDPTYSLYPVLAQIQDCPIVKIKSNADHSLAATFAKQANQAGARLTFVVNPQAPSGHLIPQADIAALADRLDGILLIDEAYVDFIHPKHRYNCLPLLQSHDRLIFLRSLSKGYGLAGLRFGYGIGPRNLIQPMMDKTRDSYNLDLFSQQIATAALADQDYARSIWQEVIQQRNVLRRGLSSMGLSSADSETNFLLVTLPTLGISAQGLYQALKAQHILVRYFAVAELQDKLRISVGTAEENARLLNVIQNCLSCRA